MFPNYDGLFKSPIAFKIFGLEIRWYGVLIAIALLIGFYLAEKLCKKRNISSDNLYTFFYIVVPAAVIGARLYYVIFEWNSYNTFLEMIDIRRGGLAIHGAIIGGLIAALIFTKKKKIQLFDLLDSIVPSLVLGQAIGRWGNYANQEAHGGPTDLPWGIIIDGEKVHPTFLYESIWNFLTFIFLIWFFNKKAKYKGEVTALYFMLYSFIRFFIEGLRTDSLMIGGLRVAQIISIILFIVGIYLYKNCKQEKYAL